MFEAFELNDENLWERPDTEGFDCVLLVLATVRTQPRIIRTQLDTHTDRETDIDSYKETDRQTDIETDRQTDICRQVCCL